MVFKSKAEVESLLKRLDMIKIELSGIVEREKERNEELAERLHFLERERMDHDGLVKWLGDAELHFSKALDCLAEATFF